MKTILLSKRLSEAAELIKHGGLVAVPTETVYGLAANGLDAAAVERIYETKGRPPQKPLSLMVPDAQSIEKYCVDVPPQATSLAERFWPGPLTIVLKARETVPPIVLGGGDTVGLRCPDHPMTLELLRLSGVPFAAPSANPSGGESPKSAEKVLEYFGGVIDAVVDGGECGIGRESTIISMARKPFRILRRGALDETAIAAALAQGLRIVGVTGGSGAGKTTALRVLREMGALVIDCDEVYHALLDEGGAMTAELARRFPEALSGGRIDRALLAPIVFSSPEALSDLNEISHRYVREEVERRLRDWAMAGGELAAVDAIELISSGLGERCETVVGVLAGRERRIERIMRRDSIEADRAAARIDAQHGDDYFREKCDIIVCNDGDEDQFSDKCKKIFTEVLSRDGRDQKQALL